MSNYRSFGKEKWPATEWKTNACADSEITVPVEKPVALRVNGEPLVILHCTPMDLGELAAGFLLGRGVIASFSDIRDFRADAALGRVDIRLNKRLSMDVAAANKAVIYSGCGQGALADASAPRPKVVLSRAVFRAASLREGLSKTLARGKLYRETRGVHSAAVCGRRGGVKVLREDIGRHNALDKVLGWTAANGIDPGTVFVAVSGRISAEAVDKLAFLQVPVLVAKGIPTSLALCRAEDLGITLAGGLGARNLRIYTHGERIRA